MSDFPNGTLITDDTTLGGIARSLHMRWFSEYGMTHARTLDWSTSATDLDALHIGARHTTRDPTGREVWATGDGWSLLVGLGGGRVQVHAVANDASELERVIDTVREACPRMELEQEQRVPIAFWSYGEHGPVQRSRAMDVPRWQEVASNYPEDVEDTLGQLMSKDFAPGIGGQLILWHGVPGTGKTWALRSLAWEWRTWCDFHYITDPETFFGSRASYMLDVLLAESDSVPDSAPADEDAPTPDPRAEGGRWRLLVLEDTGEMLAADAKERTGQGLSRLLNVVDGMIGQGLRVLVLVTTNEVLRDLHPAIKRPGRCAAGMEFVTFTPEECSAWLEQRDPGPEIDITKGHTIAELYEMVARSEDDGFGTIRPPRERQAVGFAS